MTRAEYDALPSRGTHPCPDCGAKKTQPRPGCSCPRSSGHTGPGGLGGESIYFTTHLNRNHHTCEEIVYRET